MCLLSLVFQGRNKFRVKVQTLQLAPLVNQGFLIEIRNLLINCSSSGVQELLFPPVAAHPTVVPAHPLTPFKRSQLPKSGFGAFDSDSDEAEVLNLKGVLGESSPVVIAGVRWISGATGVRYPDARVSLLTLV